MVKSVSAAVMFSLCLLTVFGVSAMAQTNSSGSSKYQETPGAKAGMPPGQAPEPEQEDESSPNVAPVLWVSSVEVMRSAHGPQLDVIRVRGITSTDGWDGGELVPLTKGLPPDGMLDLAFIAKAPANSTAPSKNPVMEAIFTLEPGHPFKGVRVHGATNRITVKTIPGYVEAPPAPGDCTNCVGKYFVGKGEALPSGASADDVIREESLPKTLHVVRPTDGIGKLDSDPNRLTLVLGDDGKIAIAIWD
jgi:hypothetical protein